MFAHLSHYNKILVTGPQRSGTTIAARMIAHDTGLTYLPEEYVRVNCERSLRHVLETHDHFVLQCPALQHLMHLPGVGDREDTLVVYTDRPLAEILASAARVGSCECPNGGRSPQIIRQHLPPVANGSENRRPRGSNAAGTGRPPQTARIEHDRRVMFYCQTPNTPYFSAGSRGCFSHFQKG